MLDSGSAYRVNNSPQFDLAKALDEFIRHAGSEVFLVRAAGNIQEGQHGDGMNGCPWRALIARLNDGYECYRCRRRYDGKDSSHYGFCPSQTFTVGASNRLLLSRGDG